MDSSLPLFRSRVLSIQSHVVHGCVGNSAAVFPMQLNGVDVDSFNILSFSNHTGYALSKGYRVTAEQFQAIADGLQLNKFTEQYNFILSGYVGNAAVMEEIGAFVKRVHTGMAPCSATGTNMSAADADEISNTCDIAGKATVNTTCSSAVYVCDPVCGDLGKLYVTAECVDVYRRVLLPLASLALPNGFEASVLSGVDITSVASAIEAADWFHSVPKVPSVVIKSFRDKDVDPDGKSIFMLVSEETTIGDATKRYSRYLIEVECVEGYFTGTGDAFGGLLMAHYAKALDALKKGESHRCLAECVAAAATATLGVLRRTKHYRTAVTGEATLRDGVRGQSASENFDARELMLIHSTDILRGDAIGVKLTQLE